MLIAAKVDLDFIVSSRGNENTFVLLKGSRGTEGINKGGHAALGLVSFPRMSSPSNARLGA